MLRIGKDHEGGEVEVGVGEPFEIEFHEHPTTGYRWHLQPLEPGITVESDDHRAGEAQPGAPSLRRWQFRASKAGTFALELQARRSWEKRPAQTFKVMIRVKPT